MMEESSKMVTDSETRRDKAAGELRDLVVRIVVLPMATALPFLFLDRHWPSRKRR